MKAIFLILTLFNMIWAVTWPTGTKAVIPLTVNHLKIGEDAANFCYQKVLLLANDQQFKNAFRSAANITIYDTVTGLIRPSRITYNTKDSVYIYFDAPASTSADKVFYVCAGLTINRTNSSTAFTNSNITNYWSMGDSVSPVIDAADAKNGTVTGATLGASGKFGRCVSFADGSNRITTTTIPTLDSVTKFTINTCVKWNNFSNDGYVFVKNASIDNKILCYTSTSNFNVWIYNGSSYHGVGYFPISGNLSTITWYLINIIYDGSQSTNDTKLKIYVNNELKSLTFTGTVPSNTGASNGTTFGYTTQALDGYIDEPLISSDAYTPGRITSRYEMVMNPSTFWTQGKSIPVNKSNNNDSRWGAFKRAFRGAFQPAYKPTYK